MALAFFASIVFAIFSGLFYLAGPDRVAGPENYRTSLGGLFAACNNAAVAEAYSHALFGSILLVPDRRVCADHAIAGVPALPLTNAMATGLSMPNITIVAEPMHDADASVSTGRVVVTYVSAGTSVNGSSFGELVRQVQQYYPQHVSVGQVVDKSGVRQIDNGAGVMIHVPLSVPVGAIAAVTRVD